MISKKDINTDLDNLHEEWRRVPVLIKLVGDALADAEEEKNLFFARQARKLREEDPKISQNKLKSMIEEMEDYIKIESNIGHLKADMDGLQAKKKGLEKNAELWINGYWSTPHEPKTKSGKYEQHIVDKQSKKQKDRINRTRT